MKDCPDKEEYYKNKNQKKAEEAEPSNDYMYYPLDGTSEKKTMILIQSKESAKENISQRKRKKKENWDEE